jgi:cyclic pyranopterin phosphate synthase
MRCVYCRPPAAGAAVSSEPDLSPHEIEALVRHLAACHGLRKVRLTGGEPLLRPDLISIVQGLAAIPGIQDLAMTTNGLQLAGKARELKAAGLRRVNISLDTLKPERFERICGADKLNDVLAGIGAAVSAGLTPVKLNTVAMRGVNDDELCDLLEFALSNDLEIRFIEMMPMGPMADGWAERFIGQDDLFRILKAIIETKHPLAGDTSAARRWRVRAKERREGIVGVVSAMSRPFCESCDRIRILADGSVCPCLMDTPSASLLPALRPFIDPAEIDRILGESLAGKPREHSSAGPNVMTNIGG